MAADEQATTVQTTPGRMPDDLLGIVRNDQRDRGRIWASSAEREWYLRRAPHRAPLAFLGASLFVACLLIGVYSLESRDVVWQRMPWAVAVVGLIPLGWAAVPYVSARLAFAQRGRLNAQLDADEALSSVVRGPDRLSLPQLYNLNRKQLDAYQAITKRQQQSAFRSAQLANGVGLVLLVAGTMLSLRQEDASAYVTGGLTALGALLSAYVSSTFLETHKRANELLNAFAEEPRETGRALAVERLLKVEWDHANRAQAPELIAFLLRGDDVPAQEGPATT